MDESNASCDTAQSHQTAMSHEQVQSGECNEIPGTDESQLLKEKISTLECEKAKLQEEMKALMEENNTLQQRLSTCERDLASYKEKVATLCEVDGVSMNGTGGNVKSNVQDRIAASRLYECGECGKKFRKLSKLTQHMTRHMCICNDKVTKKEGNAEKRGRKCWKCFDERTKAANRAYLLAQKSCSSEQKEPSVEYTCEVCDRKCLSSSHLVNHMRSHTGEKPFTCNICGRSFARMSTLRQHGIVHKEAKEWQCNLCSSKFARKDALRRHEMSHQGLKLFECDVCGKKFLHKSNMNKHSRIHTGEKPYQCTTCGKKFTTVSQMVRHTKIHTGQRDYKCDRCDKAFIEKQGLQNHYRVHTGEKPFSCEICNKPFREKNNLRKHMRMHSGEKMYLCDGCGSSFNRKGELLKHKKEPCAKIKPTSDDTCQESYETNTQPTVPLLLEIVPYTNAAPQMDFCPPSVVNDHQRSLISEMPSIGFIDPRQIARPVGSVSEQSNVANQHRNINSIRMAGSDIRPVDQGVSAPDPRIGFHDPRVQASLVPNWASYSNLN